MINPNEQRQPPRAAAPALPPRRRGERISPQVRAMTDRVRQARIVANRRRPRHARLATAPHKIRWQLLDNQSLNAGGVATVPAASPA